MRGMHWVCLPSVGKEHEQTPDKSQVSQFSYTTCQFNFLLFYILSILILHGFKSCHLLYGLFLFCPAFILLLLFLLISLHPLFFLLLLLFHSFFLPFVVMFLYPFSSFHFVLCFYSLSPKETNATCSLSPCGKTDWIANSLCLVYPLAQLSYHFPSPTHSKFCLYIQC